MASAYPDFTWDTYMLGGYLGAGSHYRTLALFMPMTIPRSVKRKVWIRAEGRCEQCRSMGDWRGLHYHHIENKGLGGSKLLDTVDNLILVCGRCHSLLHGIKEV